MILYVNPRAKYDYEILKTWEAGLVLMGHEVKAVKNKHLSLKGSYVTINKGEVYLINAHISPYKKAHLLSYEPTRTRKLLLHKKEIQSLIGKIQEKGLTLAPLKVYTKNNRIKLEFALVKGKRKIDKRELIKKREITQRLRRIMK